METTTATGLELADAPAVERLHFRRLRGDDADYEAIAAVAVAASRADGVPWAPTGVMRREELEGSDGLDIARDVILAEVDGTVVGEAGVTRRMRGGRPTYDLYGHIDPAVRRRGIGRAMLHENLRRVEERVASGEDGDRSYRVRGFADEGEVGHRTLLEAEGFTPARWFFLMRRPTLDDIPDAPLPEGIEIRPVLPDHHRAIFDAESEAFQDHWEPHDPSEAEFRSLFSRSDLDTDLWIVAWDGDAIAGVVQNWIWHDENRQLGLERGWLEHISVRRPWRRRGLGRAITAASLRRLRDAGMTDAMLGVDADNPTGALGLYEGLGFEVDQRATAYWGPTTG
jgi:mycothiol synthase